LPTHIWFINVKNKRSKFSHLGNINRHWCDSTACVRGVGSWRTVHSHYTYVMRLRHGAYTVAYHTSTRYSMSLILLGENSETLGLYFMFIFSLYISRRINHHTLLISPISLLYLINEYYASAVRGRFSTGESRQQMSEAFWRNFVFVLVIIIA